MTHINYYQQTQQLWQGLFAYNACHILELQEAPDLARLASTIQKFIAGTGFKKFCNREISLQLQETTLDFLVTHELNKPFLANDFIFRFLVLQNEDNYYFGICYDHLYCDSFALRRVLLDLYQNYINQSNNFLAYNFTGIAFEKLYAKQLKFKRLKLLRGVLHNIIFYRDCYRVRLENADLTCEYYTHTLKENCLQKLKKIATQYHCTINTLFSVILAQELYKMQIKNSTEIRKKFRVRNKVSLGIICDLRKYTDYKLENSFSQQLGGIMVKFSPQDLLNLQLSIQNMQRQVRSKLRSPIINVLMNKLLHRMWFRKKTVEKRLNLFHKHCPIMAGISNINLDGCKLIQGLPSHVKANIKNYYRASPTGIVAPLVVAISNYNGRLNLSMTFRKSAYTSAQITALSYNIQENIDNIV